MKISDTTTRTVTIVLEGAEISNIETIVRGYLRASNECRSSGRAARAILEAITGD